MAESITLQTSDSDIVTSDVLGRLSFAASSESSGSDAILIGASIYAMAESSFTEISNATSIIFATANSESAIPRLKINNYGHFIPLIDKTYDIGSSGLIFRNVHGESGLFNNILSNGIPVSISGHQHASNDISDFNSSVSGLLPVKDIIAGTGLGISSSSGIYTISSTASGVSESSSLITNVFNKTANTINKGSVVYINGGQGDQPTIQLAIASNELGSSKTYGIVQNNIPTMSLGKVVVAGALTTFDTDQFNPTAPTGDVNGTTLWLSPSVSGAMTTTKPSAPYHMVSVGTIVRTHQNEGVIEVQIQNGYELEELHNVAISGVTNGQFLQYNGSGLWVPSSSGNFSTLLVNGTGVSLSGHTHTASNITDFDSSVSGLLPPIANSGDNRLLTSDGTSYGINGESNLTFDGNLLNVIGSGIFSSGITASFIIASSGTAANPSFEFLNDIDTGLFSPAANTVSVATSGVERFRITESGNVGIGTVSPGSRLDVNGNVNIDGNLTFDSFTESVVAIGNSSTSKTIDLTAGTVQTCTLTANCVFTMPTATAGKSFTLFLSTGAGSFTGTFTGVRWAGGTAPTITTTASKVDILSFISDGSFWYGSYSQNYG